MAVTKILYRNGGLRQAIDYITNPAKTNEQLLTDYVRCDPGHAAQQMMDTKRALGKTAGRQCYHIIQSFKQRCTRGYKRYKETSGLIEWKECQIFHSIFT